MLEKHAKYPPSSSHLWLSCPHSELITSKLPEEEESEASKEGTRLHEVMEKFLKKRTFNYFNKKNKHTYNDFLKDVQGGKKIAPLERGRMTSNLFKCMCELHAQAQRDLEGFFGKDRFMLVYYEERVDMKGVIKDCWGTADLTIITPLSIYTCDYKFGRVKVDPQTPQLNMYSIGSYQKHVLPRIKDFPELHNVFNVILQPKLYATPKYYEYDVKWLLEIEKISHKHAKKNLLPKVKRKPITGTHCEKYAKCRPYCDVYNKKNLKEIKKAFGKI
jgi:hypothetical protein